MRGVILAAGRGSRMGPHTADRPKCLMEINGASLLERQLAALRHAAITEAAVVTGWRAERFVGKPVRLLHNPRWDSSTMVDSVAREPDPIVIGYDPDWLPLWSRRFDDPLTDAETFRLRGDGTLAQIGARPRSLEEIEGQYVGLLKFEPDGWETLRTVLAGLPAQGRRNTTALLNRLIDRVPFGLRAVPIPGPWHEFDTPSDLQVGRTALDELDKELSADKDERR
ncbi:phosphocholine cytidylyltransferase family protein [Actinomadura fulvescens]|uniref:Phosphocholine cytidylyltransferase family protein n=1 Tax=Actinomadura fulvescens TaxID=46160 RepID=A0ABP6CQH3_9ACTN